MLPSLKLSNVSRVGSAWHVTFVTLPIPLPVTARVFRVLSQHPHLRALLHCALVQNSPDAPAAMLLPGHCHGASEGPRGGLWAAPRDHCATAELRQGRHSCTGNPACPLPALNFGPGAGLAWAGRCQRHRSAFGLLSHCSEPRCAGVGHSCLPRSALTSVKICFI